MSMMSVVPQARDRDVRTTRATSFTSCHAQLAYSLASHGTRDRVGTFPEGVKSQLFFVDLWQC